VTLLVIGGGAVPARYGDLAAAMRYAPAFAIGFAFLAMFWHGHVHWRGYRSRGGALPVLLSLVLVFLVLVYVYPLRLMSVSLVEFIVRDIKTIRSSQEVADLFALYGLGFTAMAGAMAALFATSLRASNEREARRGITGEIGIWLILAATGAVSALVSRVSPASAPWVYSLLPVAIPLFVRRHYRQAPSEAQPPASAGR
jgi:hypothetical protein